MTHEPDRVGDLFLAAVDLSLAERAAYLGSHSPEPELRQAVERLLVAHDQFANLTTYRMQKLARRYRTVLATTAALALLLGGILVSSWQVGRALRAEARTAAAEADQARAEAERQKDSAGQAAAREAEERAKAVAARKEAQAREREANAVVAFFEDKFFQPGRPKGQEGGLGHDMLLREAIRASLPALATRFAAQPLVEARLRDTLGSTYLLLGDSAQAAEQHERARDLFLRQLGPEHPDTLRSMTNLANCYAAQNRQPEALPMLEETLATRKRVLGPDHPDTLESMTNLADSYAKLNRHAEAIKLLEETLAAQKRVLGSDHPETLKCMGNLANSYAALNRHAEALQLREHTLAAQKRVLGPDHPDTLESMTNLARSYAALNRPAEALKLLEETLAACKRVLPPDHPDALQTMAQLAQVYFALDRATEALTLIDRLLARANRPGVQPSLLLQVIDLRRRHFQKAGDPAGCRATAEMWEKLDRKDADSLYQAAVLRTVTASVQARATDADAAALARADADRAMAWLTKAVAAGFTDADRLRQDKDLAFLRDREDFQKLVADLEQKKDGK
jgi:hypothetical protein